MIMPGLDGIPPCILNELAEELAAVLTIIYSATLNKGTLLDEWKIAHVSPIYKKDDPLSP